MERAFVQLEAMGGMIVRIIGIARAVQDLDGESGVQCLVAGAVEKKPKAKSRLRRRFREFRWWGGKPIQLKVTTRYRRSTNAQYGMNVIQRLKCNYKRSTLVWTPEQLHILLLQK